MAPGHEPRRRWPMLVIGGIAAVLLVIAFVVGATLLLRVLAPSTGSPLSDAQASSASRGTAAPEPSARGEENVLDPARVPWVAALPAIDADGARGGWYALSAGTLEGPDPLVDLQVDLAPIGANLAAFHAPTALAVGDDGLVYVSDDGTVSSVHVGPLAADGEFELIAALPEVVWSGVVERGGAAIYVQLLDRVNLSDSGVWRIPLPQGAGPPEAPELVLASRPPVLAAADARLAAIPSFSSVLYVDADGQWLARLLCNGPDCGTDVVSLATGEAVARGLAIAPIGFAGDWLVSEALCDARLGCALGIENFASGARDELPWAPNGAWPTDPGGRPLLVRAVSAQQLEGGRLEVVDLESGEVRHLVSAGQREEFMIFRPGASLAVYTLPAGWVRVDLLRQQGVAPTFAVHVDGGEPMELPIPNVTLPPAGPAQG